MEKIKFDIKEYYVLIASLIIGIPLVIFFYSVTTPKEFMGYLTFFAAFTILPIGMIYWFLSEIKNPIKGITKLRKIKVADNEEKKESDQKEHKSHEHKEHKSHENKEEHKPHEHKEHENKEHHEKKEGSD